MPRSDCKKFETCSAPLCPFDKNKNYVWYPDEDICSRALSKNFPWLRKQKRMQRKGMNIDNGAFTRLMLKCENFKMTSKLFGLSMGKDWKLEESEWIKLRSGPKKEMSAERKEEFLKMVRARQKK